MQAQLGHTIARDLISVDKEAGCIVSTDTTSMFLDDALQAAKLESKCFLIWLSVVRNPHFVTCAISLDAPTHCERMAQYIRSGEGQPSRPHLTSSVDTEPTSIYGSTLAGVFEDMSTSLTDGYSHRIAGRQAYGFFTTTWPVTPMEACARNLK